MQAIRKTATVLLFPTIVWLGAACERAGMPTEPQSVSNDLNAAATGSVRWVNDDDPNGFAYAALTGGTSCNDPGYKTVQDGVNAAVPGDRINVCPGTYTEQVTIGKSDLQLRSTKRWEAVIKAPPMVDGFSQGEGIVRIENPARNVTILAFTIAGPGSGFCGSIGYGIRVNDATANILGNHITDIRDQYQPGTGELSGCQNGWGIVVGERFADTEHSNASAKIEGNVIEHYQKNGVVVGGNDSFAEIRANRVLGFGQSKTIAQNGIEPVSGGSAKIEHNFVSQHLYIGTENASSSGILLYQSGSVATEHNTVPLNDVGIWMIEAASGSATTKNHVRGSTFDGVAVDGSTGNQVANNKTEHNSGPGIGMYGGAQNNGLDNNHVSDNGDSGILLDDNAHDNTVSKNQVRDNGTGNSDMTDGIRINSTSMNNTISGNHLKNNVTHDCHDWSVGTRTANTANTWTDNRGETSVPAALCGEDDNDADFETSTAYGWDPSYPWATTYGDAADLDWAAAYATIDTNSLLQLLPSIRIRALHGPKP